jgi:hypothetical protein
MDHGWSLKHLHRRIMLSSTYQLSSVASGQSLKKDQQNRLLWHFPRHRLEGEIIRDAMLVCAGTLNAKISGPAVVPPLSAQELATVRKQGRPVTMTVRTYPRVHLLAGAADRAYPSSRFDPPEVMVSCPQRRGRWCGPGLDAAQQSADSQRRCLCRAGCWSSAGRRRITCSPALNLAFGRDITATESERALDIPAKLGGLAACPIARKALADLCSALFNASEFITID